MIEPGDEVVRYDWTRDVSGISVYRVDDVDYAQGVVEIGSRGWYEMKEFRVFATREEVAERVLTGRDRPWERTP